MLFRAVMPCCWLRHDLGMVPTLTGTGIISGSLVILLGVKSLNKARERVPRLASLHLCQHRLGLWEPEGHVHTPIHLHRHRQRGTALLLLTSRGIQQAQAAVAVCLDRTPAPRRHGVPTTITMDGSDANSFPPASR